MKMIVFDGWEVLLMLITIIGVCVALYNRGFRKGMSLGKHPLLGLRCSKRR